MHKQDFPALQQQVHGKPLVYLDNAATTQKPQIVIDTLSHYYSAYNANVHRGVHKLSELATEEFESARSYIQKFINAAAMQEIIFTRGTTEAINLVAASYGRTNIKAGDEIIISAMEHHSNIVPWQMLCEATGAKLKVIPINSAGELEFEAFATLLTPKTKLVAVTYISNALGTINPIQEIINLAHQADVPVLVDAAQALHHTKIDVQALDCDFLACSGHKSYGPTGIGFLYAKQALLEAMPPYQGGGDMILQVSFNATVYNELPHKFEAGTPNIAGAIGFAAALKYLSNIGFAAIEQHEADLLSYSTQVLSEIPGLSIIGTAKNKAGVVSFVLDDVHAHDIGTILDQQGIAIRTGHHCAMPVMQHFGVAATARASLCLYNTKEDIDILVAGIHTVRKMFKLC